MGEQSQPWTWSGVFGPGGPGLDGLFIGDKDDEFAPDENAIRIMGFRSIRIEGQDGGYPAYAEYQSPNVVVEPQSAYLLSFDYSSARFRKGYPLIVLGEQKLPPAINLVSSQLPDTQGKWVRQFLVVWNETARSANVMVKIRNWGEGDVWFSDLNLWKIELSPQYDVRGYPEDQEAFWIVDLK